MKYPLLRATLAAGLLGILAVVGHSQGQLPADLVLLGGKIVTVDSAVPFGQAVAIRDDRIVGVGRDSEMEAFVGPDTKTIHLNGKLVIPGFIEGHAHLMDLGQVKGMLDLTRAKTWSEIVTMVGEKVKSVKPGEWIEGNGWHQDKWTSRPVPSVGGLPVHDSLSLVSPNNPVALYHASGHQWIANAKAMELAEITHDTPNPEGGEIIRDSAGRPIGVFLENASNLIYEAQQKSFSTMTPEEVVAADTRALSLGMEECAANGITSLHDAGETFARIDLLTQLAQENKLPIRLWVMIRDNTSVIKKHLSEYPRVGLGSDHLTIRAIKLFADGALGSRGAWLLEPYDDMPQSTGQILTPLDSLETVARLAAAQSLQICTHACGDRANREILNLYERVFKSYPEKKDWRWRIEHAQHIHPIDVPRFGQLGIIAAMQGVHCTSDGPWVPSRLGERRAVERSYLWHDLIHSGALVINGTDAPVENVSPIACFYSSVTRKLPDGSIFAPDQRMTRDEALRSYTINAAYAGFEESLKGSITVGKLADIVVLSKDIMTIPEDEILSTEVLYTIVGGKIIYQK
jgi:predicted amidohydrolase YtcJ